MFTMPDPNGHEAQRQIETKNILNNLINLRPNGYDARMYRDSIDRYPSDYVSPTYKPHDFGDVRVSEDPTCKVLDTAIVNCRPNKPVDVEDVLKNMEIILHKGMDDRGIRK